MIKNGLSASIIFEASSANYGEGIGNISLLKKMTRAGGETYTYISRQAMRYNIVQQMGFVETPVDVDQKVIQFSPDTDIADYPEIDLFGYMKTGKGINRSAVVRLSNAISLEPYKSDTDYLTNMGLSARKPELKNKNAIAQSEIHKSLYCYTVTIDLDKVGIDKATGTEIDKSERAERVKTLLDTIQFLYRDIKGRRENLNPIFAVGGVYERKNPYFEDRLKLSKKNLNTDMILDVINSCNDTKDNTVVGMVSGFFGNDNEIKEKLSAVSVSELFAELKKEVDTYYA